MKHRERESGQGLVEYAFILVLIAVAVIVALTLFGNGVQNTYVCLYNSVAALGGAEGPAIKSFVLVDANSDQDITGIPCGGTITLTGSGHSSVSIRMETSGDVNQLDLDLQGPVTHVQSEFIVPFSLFGDNPPGQYAGQALPPGRYVLKATPYDSSGNVGRIFEINFRIK